MQLSPTAAIVLGLLLAAWTFAAAVALIDARGRVRQARAARASARRLARMVEHSPAIPLLVRGDGALEGPARLAAWLGLERLPRYLSELRGEEGGLAEDDLEHLRHEVRRTLKTAAPFRLEVIPRGSQRSLVLLGQFADRLVAPEGAALVWWFDHSENDAELAALREEIAALRTDFGAVMQLVEAAPVPMWFRRDDLALAIVNRAYVEAVGEADAASVLRGEVELVEPVDGRKAAQFAQDALDRGAPVERVAQVTVDGQRRSMRVRDLPIEGGGVAGFALDVEAHEAQARALAALGAARRALLERLSVGVAEFDAHRQLAYANQPFRRLFALGDTGEPAGLEFARFLDRAREAGRVPESGNFPAWRRALGEWFAAAEPVEQAWPLSDGTHLRIVGVPMPDGGLVLLAEDRSEQLAFSARRDMLTRTATATLDAIDEAVVVFTPEGGVKSWNRRFPGLLELDVGGLSHRPRAEDVLAAIATRLEPGESGAVLGEAVRAATLERQAREGRVALLEGRVLGFTAAPLPDGNGLLALREIGGAEAAQRTQRACDEALAAARGEHEALLADLAGALRSGLLAIGGSAEALRLGAPGDHPAAILEQTGELADRLARLVREDDAIDEAPALSPSEVELMPLVTTIVREREAAIEAKDITLNLSGAKRSGTAMVDERQFAQALGALVDDAVAQAPRGGRIDVSLSRLRGEVRIEVVGDTKDMPEGWTPGEGEALPLGAELRRVRRIVEAHGGRLRLRPGPAGTRIVSITLA